MFIIRNKGSGNKFTLISIIMIIAVIYIFRLISPQKEIEYPDTMHYNNVKYEYAETVKGLPFMFVRKRPVSEEGFIILVRRGTDTQEEIFMYEGFRKYRRYEALRE
ncbi:MAG TPA: hypothetical protein PKU88_08555 [Bacillota bacterium]|nr:hypothetical protein [Clostridiaceae bacterium]HNR03707.1 hypothetical protein [Bacillota bacterium]HNT04161.1 hypothetical protein [Bacillota bacterium]HPX69363.1 hypothetical protein [Bacillota bacterium]HQA65671.1 hypothetical protein [Bacillota bacterium]